MLVSLEDGAEQAAAIAEVILKSGHVTRAGGAHDLPEADAVDTFGGEEALRRGDEAVPRLASGRAHD